MNKTAEMQTKAKGYIINKPLLMYQGAKMHLSEIYKTYEKRMGEAVKEYNFKINAYNNKVRIHNDRIGAKPVKIPQGYPLAQDKNKWVVQFNEKCGKNQAKALAVRINPLNRQTRALYMRLHILLASQVNKNTHYHPGIVSVDILNPSSIYTNYKHLIAFFDGKNNPHRRAASTIYRQINRLMEWKMISQKVFHGTQRNYELYLNPATILWEDMEDGKYINPLAAQLLENNLNEMYNGNIDNLEENTRLAKLTEGGTIATCNLLSKSELFNNLIIPVQKVSGDTNPKKAPEKQFKPFPNKPAKTARISPDNGKTPKIGDIIGLTPSARHSANGGARYTPPSKNSNNSQKSDPRQPQKRMLRANGQAQGDYNPIHAAVNVAIAYALNILFKFHNVYPGEKDRAMQVIEKTYFTDIYTQKELDNRLKRFNYCVDMANRHIVRHKIDFSNIFPTAYFDPGHNGRMSFYNVWHSWFRKDAAARKKQYHNRVKARQRKDLERVYEKVKNNYNLANFRKAEAYISDKYPHMRNEFLAMFTNQ